MRVLLRAFMDQELDAALTGIGPRITQYNDLVARQEDRQLIRISKTTKSRVGPTGGVYVDCSLSDVAMAKTSS